MAAKDRTNFKVVATARIYVSIKLFRARLPNDDFLIVTVDVSDHDA